MCLWRVCVCVACLCVKYVHACVWRVHACEPLSCLKLSTWCTNSGTFDMFYFKAWKLGALNPEEQQLPHDKRLPAISKPIAYCFCTVRFGLMLGLCTLQILFLHYIANSRC